jgi:transcriptional regulator with XRE-family HTH domain
VRINGEAVRALRIALGWSTVRFAEAVGIKHPHLSNIEAGRRQASPELITRMADVLDVPKAAITSTYAPEQVA